MNKLEVLLYFITQVESAVNRDHRKEILDLMREARKALQASQESVDLANGQWPTDANVSAWFDKVQAAIGNRNTAVNISSVDNKTSAEWKALYNGATWPT